MYRVELRRTIDDSWRSLDRITIGTNETGRTPDAYLAIERDKAPCLLIDAYRDVNEGPFTDAICWRNFAVLGWCDSVTLVDIANKTVRTLKCAGYFGHFFASDAALLVASASELFCVNTDGRELWRSSNLGIDGVVVRSIVGDEVKGEGEWDPPGGWRPFTLDITTGAQKEH